MKKKILFMAIPLMVLPILLTSCVPTNTPAATQTETPISQLQSWKASIDQWKLTTADPAIAKINAMQSGGDTSQVQSELASARATISSLNSDLNSALVRLTTAENDIKALKESVSVTTTTTNPIGSTGNIPQFTAGVAPTEIATSINGGVVSQVNYSSGGNQLYSSPTSSGQMYYIQRLINQNSATTLYATPIINMSCSNYYGGASYTAENVTRIDIMLSSASYIGYTGATNSATFSSTNATQNMIMNGSGTIASYYLTPPLGTPSYSLKITPNFTYYKGIPIPAGGYTDVSVQLSNLYTTPGGVWNVTPSCDFAQ